MLDKTTIQTWFERLVTYAESIDASDIFMNADSPVAVKINGAIQYVKDQQLSDAEIYTLIEHLTRPDTYQRFVQTHELNLMANVQDRIYLRVNCYMQKNLPGLVMRLIPSEVPKIESLHLPQPDVLRQLALLKRGMVIMVGATGNGKSTTAASMLDYRNEHAHSHIITVEDPIEFMHRSKQSVVIQREVGVDTKDYATALKNSLREAPDVVLIGEIRDRDTMDYAMQFAETGHLCFATLHATDSVQAIERILNFFPREQREKVQMDLANNLQCLISQRLLPHATVGRIVAMEMLRVTPYIQQLILDGKLEEIPEQLERGDATKGVFSFDRSIFDLYEAGEISYDVATQYVRSPNDFRVRVRNQSQRPLPGAIAGNGAGYAVQSEESLDYELLKNSLEEKKRTMEGKR